MMREAVEFYLAEKNYLIGMDRAPEGSSDHTVRLYGRKLEGGGVEIVRAEIE